MKKLRIADSGGRAHVLSPKTSQLKNIFILFGTSPVSIFFFTDQTLFSVLNVHGLRT